MSYKIKTFPITTPIRYLILLMQFIAICSLSAQVGNFGNVFIGKQDEVAVHTDMLYLNQGSGGVFPGILGTERSLTPGFMGFVGVSSALNGNDQQYIDGYAKSYMAGPILFPLGDNGVYRPAAISNSSVTSPSNASYFGVNPSLAVTSSLRGGSEPILPSGIVYPTTVRDSTITFIDTSGYWDINGTVPTRISLSWVPNSNIGEFTTDLKRITIVGWSSTNGGWEEVPSILDEISMFGTASTLISGSISSQELVPSNYDVYAIGFKIVPKQAEIFAIPNYFSPNGDNMNDQWVLPDSLFAMYPETKVTIYNRWGNVVWRSEGRYKNNWGGDNLLTNSPLPDGVYYYILELEPKLQTIKSGFVEVMRN